MAKTREIKLSDNSRYFAVRLKNQAEIDFASKELGYAPRKVQMPQSDPITIIGRFKVRAPADSLAREINAELNGEK